MSDGIDTVLERLKGGVEGYVGWDSIAKEKCVVGTYKTVVEGHVGFLCGKLAG